MAAEERPIPKPRRWRFVAGGVTVALVIAWLILSSTQETAVYALTISELKAQCPAIYGQGARVGGTVDGRTISWNARDLLLEFNLVDEDEILPVTYKGARPDMFRDGAQAVVEGQFQPSGLFEATKLLLKCPSKYEAEATDAVAR